MRLLNTLTLQLESFVQDIPRYAILSHTWEQNEVTFHDLSTGTSVQNRRSWAKIVASCGVARAWECDYIWIDTCCIDKSSSAELSEAINSMFHWYRQAEICLAFLSDVNALLEGNPHYMPAIRWSRWFTRGWTLQELVAPREVAFYNGQWQFLGLRSEPEIRLTLEQTTRIPQEYLRTGDIRAASVAQKMSWAATRQTTRPEDTAYSLMGLFEVNMPLLYGEGSERAFLRLQEQIFQQTEDETIFAWRCPEDEATSKNYWGLFATKPSYFLESALCQTPQYLAWSPIPPVVNRRGVRMKTSLVPFPGDESGTVFLATLGCVNGVRRVGIVLQKLSPIVDEYCRIVTNLLIFMTANSFENPYAYIRHPGYPRVHMLHFKEPKPQQVFIQQNPWPSAHIAGAFLSLEFSPRYRLQVLDTAGAWEYWNRAPRHRRHNRHHAFLHDFPSEDSVYVIEFADMGDEEDGIRVNLSQVGGPTNVGVMTLRFALRDRRYAVDQNYARTYNIIFGLDRLEENPFLTPPAFVRSWCTIVSGRHSAATVLERHDRRRWHGREENALPDGHNLECFIDTVQRFQMQYYRVGLRSRRPPESTRAPSRRSRPKEGFFDKLARFFLR